MKCCCLVLLSLWIVLICFKMVKVAQSPISQSGGKNPSRGEGQLKKNALNSNMETYWERIFMPQRFYNNKACQEDRRQVVY